MNKKTEKRTSKDKRKKTEMNFDRKGAKWIAIRSHENCFFL